MKTTPDTIQAGEASGSAAANKAQWIAENLKEDELYAGLILGLDGTPDHHVILLPGEAEGVTWEAAKVFATKIGGERPTTREQALLDANLQREFQPRWYWSCEQHAASDDYAWGHNFDTGGQYYYESASLRARAVRRLTIQ